MTEESKTPETEDTPAEAVTESIEAAPDADAVGEGDATAAEGTAQEAANAAAEEAPAVAETGEEAAADAASDEDTAGEEATDGPDDTASEAAKPSEGATEDEEAPAAEADAPEPEAIESPEEPPQEEPHYDFDTLHNMNVHQLREVAANVDHDAVHGYSTMHKEELLHALCVAFGVEEHVHHEVVGIDKVAIKAKIIALKIERDAAIAAGDKKHLKRIRRRIHNLKHRIRKATI